MATTAPRKCIGHPKEPLSYLWTIAGVKALLELEECLESPHFKVLISVEGVDIVLTLYLRLTIMKQDYFVSIRSKDLDEVVDDELSGFFSFWVKDGVFSVLDSDTREVKYTVELKPKVCDTDGVLIGPVKLFARTDFDKYLSKDGSLTLEVTASLEQSDSAPIPPCNVLEGMKKIYEEMPLTDFTIKCGDEEFKAHKVILASQSPVFYRMFQTDMTESRDNLVEIPDIAPAVMADLIAFMYTGKPPNLNKLVKELLCAANKYEMPRLVAMCENELMLKLHLDNVLDTVQCADAFGAPNLKKTCMRIIKCNFSQLACSKEWKAFKESSHKDLAFEMLEFNNLL